MSETQHSRDALDSVDQWMADRAMSFDSAVRVVQRAEAVVCIGVGKSLIVAQLAASLLRSVGVRATAAHATDLLHGDMNFLPFWNSGADRSVVIAFSHSGRTDEVISALRAAKKRTVFTVAITSTQYETIGKLSNLWLSYECVDGSKHGTIPTASVTAQLAFVNEIVCAIADDVSNHDLLAGHQHGALGSTYEERSHS